MNANVPGSANPMTSRPTRQLWWEPARWIGLALVLLAVVLTVWSGLVNLKDGLRLRREALAGSTSAS